jgi:intracellular multiplication protein IcmO
MDTKSSSFEKRARIDLLDLKEQTEGEAHIFFKSKIVRARMFYANPKPVKELKVNQFMKVEAPSDDYIAKLHKQIQGFQSLLDSGDLAIRTPVENEDITFIANALRESTAEDPIERGVSALIAYHKLSEPEAPPVAEEAEEQEEIGLTIFRPLDAKDCPLPILARDKEQFSAPLLPLSAFRTHLTSIERVSGANDRYAGSVAAELVKDFRRATQYPPEERDTIDSVGLATLVQELASALENEKKKKKENAEGGV